MSFGVRGPGFKSSCAKYLLWDQGKFSEFLSQPPLFSHVPTGDNDSTYKVLGRLQCQVLLQVVIIAILVVPLVKLMEVHQEPLFLGVRHFRLCFVNWCHPEESIGEKTHNKGKSQVDKSQSSDGQHEDELVINLDSSSPHNSPSIADDPWLVGVWGRLYGKPLSVFSKHYDTEAQTVLVSHEPRVVKRNEWQTLAVPHTVGSFTVSKTLHHQ